MKPFRDMYWQSHDRLRLYARVYDAPDPKAPSLLCLSGLRRNCRDFEDLAPHLQPRFNVIAPDFRGRGLSTRDRHVTNYQVNVYVRDLLKLVEVLHLKNLLVLGTALGGIVAMMMAAAQPGLVSAMILNDIGPRVSREGRDRWLRQIALDAKVRDWVEAVQCQKELYGAGWPGLSAERWAQLTRRVYREDAYGHIQLDCDPMVTDLERQWPASDADLWPMWDKIKPLPLLVIRGATSDILSADTLARMGETHPDLRSLTLPDRGHFPLLDEPAALTAIDEFLGELDLEKPT